MHLSFRVGSLLMEMYFCSFSLQTSFSGLITVQCGLYCVHFQRFMFFKTDHDNTCISDFNHDKKDSMGIHGQITNILKFYIRSYYYFLFILSYNFFKGGGAVDSCNTEILHYLVFSFMFLLTIMATRLAAVLSSRLKTLSISQNNNSRVLNLIQKRTMVCQETGALLPKPEKTPLGLTKVAIVVTPFLTLGTILGREGASFLEESEIFVPDDDDD